MPRIANVTSLVLSSLLVAACGTNGGAAPLPESDASAPERDSSTPSTSDSAPVRAYSALTHGSQGELLTLIADLDAEVEADPENGWATFYSALMRFWQFGERIDLPPSQSDVLTEAGTMIERFRTAQRLLPADDRAPAFGGLAKVIIGNVTADPSLASEGMTDIDEGIAIFPAYSHFLRALASAQSLPDSDDFAAVLPHMQAVIDTCGVARTPSGEYEYLEGPVPPELRPCNDDGIVPHVWEGFFVMYGDLLLKAGRSADEARAMYRTATRAPRFDHWPFVSALEERIAGADARAELYADGDLANDPVIWMDEGHVCTGCHQDQP